MPAFAPDRHIFLDNLRSLLVLLIVALHAAAAYSSVIPWWYAYDAPGGAFFDITVAAVDAFDLSALYFLAGFFTLESLRRRDTGPYVKGRLLRLGVPYVLLTLLWVPAITYVGHLRWPEWRSLPGPLSFWEYWREGMAALDWSPMLITRLGDPRLRIDTLTPAHLWFVSLLILFSLSFASLRALAVRLRPAGGSEETTPRAMILTLLVAILAAGAGAGLFLYRIPDASWARMGQFLIVQPTRLPVYVIMFALGAYACRNGWFIRRDLPGSPWLWLGAFLVSLLGCLVTGNALAQSSPDVGVFPALAHGLLRAAVAVTAIAMLTGFARRWWNRPTRLNRSLAAGSYDIYLLHLPIQVMLQYALIPNSVPLTLKFLLAFAFGLAVPWAVSGMLIRRNKMVALGALLAVFVTMTMFWR